MKYKYPEIINEETLKINAHLSDVQIRIDFENTTKEAKAYSLLAKGFHMLSKLPENKENGISRKYSVESDVYYTRRNECWDFASFLSRLSEARNINLDD